MQFLRRFGLFVGHHLKFYGLILLLSVTSAVAHATEANQLKVKNIAQTENQLSYLIVVQGVSETDWANIQRKLNLSSYTQYAAPGGKAKVSKAGYRLGFFSSKDKALSVLIKIRGASKNKIKLIIKKSDEFDKKYRLNWLKIKAKNQAESLDNKLTRLMEQARQALLDNNYRVAVSIYTKVVSFDDPKHSQLALEYLALARERANQMAHARNEYQRYLKLYPKGKGAERVMQRLAGLMTAAQLPRKKLVKYKKRAVKLGWISVSSLTQSYRTDREIETPIGANKVFANGYSNFFYMAIMKKPGYELKNQISLSNKYDFASDDEDNERIRISYLYADSKFKRLGVSARVGRQRNSASGLFGRFDGAALSYSVTDNFKISATSGFPVSFQSYQRIQQEKLFYSTNIEFESLFGLFDLNTYFITQYNDTLLDRQAIGFDLRHFSQTRTFFSTIDYDLSYSAVNNLMINASAKVDKRNTFSTYMTFRRSPLLMTGNSLQGQLAGSLGELLKEKEEETIRQLARDRTAKYVSLTFNWKQHIKKNIEISHGYTISQLGATIASDGVFAIRGTGYEDFFSTQLIASDLWTKNDMLLVGLSHAIMDTNERTALSITRRDYLSGKLSMSVKFRAEYQERSNGSFIKRMKPTIKMDYRHTRKYKFDTEFGIDHRIYDNSFDEGVYQTLFFSIGYTAQF